MVIKRLIPAVVYYRMSTDKQDASIAQQRIAVEKYAKEHGYRPKLARSSFACPTKDDSMTSKLRTSVAIALHAPRGRDMRELVDSTLDPSGRT